MASNSDYNASLHRNRALGAQDNPASWGPGENLPKFILVISLAEKTGIISAYTCPVAPIGSVP